MACTNITVSGTAPGVTITNKGFGTTNALGRLGFEYFSGCTIPGSMVGKPVIIGVDFEGAGLINLLTIKVSYTDYLGATVTKTKTGVVSALSGFAIVDMGRNYHAGNYSNLVVTATAAI